MSVGDLLWAADPRNPSGWLGSPQKQGFEARQKRLAELQESRRRRINDDREIERLLEIDKIERGRALGVAAISGDAKDRDANRQLNTARGTADIYAGTVLPATTQSTIAINANDYKGKIGLTEAVGEVASNLQSEGITARSNAAEKFFPTLTSQITTLQKAPVDLATRAILSQETMAQKDRDFIKEMYLLQNPKRNFREQLLSVAPGLAAAAFLAFS